MAVIVPNKTKCVICGDVIISAKDAVAFPAFIPCGHKFSQFSDSVFHADCFSSWSERETFQSLYDTYRKIWDTRPSNLESLEDIEAWGRNAFDDLFAPGMTEHSTDHTTKSPCAIRRHEQEN